MEMNLTDLGKTKHTKNIQINQAT